MWPLQKDTYDLHPEGKEIETNINVIQVANKKGFTSLLAQIFKEGEYLRNVHKMCYILRIRDRFRGINRGYTSKNIGVEEIEYVKNEIILFIDIFRKD